MLTNSWRWNKKLKEIKKKDTLGKLVSGKSITETEVAEKGEQHVENQGRHQQPKRNWAHQHILRNDSDLVSPPKPGTSYILIEDSFDFTDADTCSKENARDIIRLRLQTSLFVLLYFFFWPLCCLSLDLRILIIHLVSSISSDL